jgi:hypothetical protein
MRWRWWSSGTSRYRRRPASPAAAANDHFKVRTPCHEPEARSGAPDRRLGARSGHAANVCGRTQIVPFWIGLALLRRSACCLDWAAGGFGWSLSGYRPEVRWRRVRRRCRSCGLPQHGRWPITPDGACSQAAVLVAQICPFRLLIGRRSVAGDCHARLRYHQHLCRLQRHRAVPHPARNRECHPGSQLHWVATLEFDAQPAVDDIEEFVLLLVLGQ